MTAPSPTDAPPLRIRLLRLWPYFGLSRWAWLAVLVATTIGAGTEPFIPAMLKPLLDQGFQQGAIQVWYVPLTLLALSGVRGIAGYVAQIGLTHITNVGLLTLRRRMFDVLLHADPRLFAKHNASALSNTLVYEVQSGSQMLVNSLLSLTRNSLTLVALTIYLLILNWQLALVVAAVAPAVVWVMRMLSGRLQRLMRATQSATDELAYVVEENVLAYRDVRLYGAQPSQAERFDGLSGHLRQLALKATVAGAAMTPMTQLLAAMALSTVIAIALVQSAHGNTSVGGFVAFVTAMLMTLSPMRQLSEVSGPISRGLIALERALELIDGTPHQPQGGYVPAGRCKGALALHEVRLRYAPGAAPALDGVTLAIAPGETVALVGASGSGKTTLVHLLPRFVEPDSGSITLDGHALPNWNLLALRAQFALVSQHVVMLNDTVAANVALGQEPDPIRVQDCLQAANLGSWVTQLPQGLDTRVGHNAMQLSGGQRQRLAIARALYKDAPVLILDEATSALDTESERLVQEALQRLLQGRTTIIVAHRLSTIQHADRIVVLEHGRIVESGRHAELLARGGVYARLTQGAEPVAMASA